MYIVITKRNIYHEGDERSKQYPGHGYPAWTEEVNVATKFTTKDLLIAWLARNKDTKVEVFEAEPVKVVQNISIDVKTL